jgi:steroid delta-isomerase-like uncharacterized protein
MHQICGGVNMKKLFMVLPLVFLLCFTFACQDKEAMAELEAMKAQAEVEEQNKALFMRFYEAWFKGDIEALKEVFSPNYVWHQTSGQDLSLEETLEEAKQQMETYSDRSFSKEDIIAKGDKAVMRVITRGTHTGDVEGFLATGKKFEVNSIEIIRVESGKIVESWEVFNNLSYYQQLGMELKPKEGEK